jgi:hypothetical protein
LQLENMAANADDNQVARHLEAFLLWLFGWIMFTRSKGDIVNKWFIEFAKEIADAPEDPGPEDIPKYSWGSALLCAMYRALCRGCTKSSAGSRLDGCPLFLQLWSLERFQIGRPKVETPTYGPGMYGKDDVDAPTFGSLWCSKEVRPLLTTYHAPYIPYIWSNRVGIPAISLFCSVTGKHVQVRKSYAQFTEQFDHLTADMVRWEPYTEEEIQKRAPHGLSSLCTRDREYWLTRKKLVFDARVEDYAAHRVMRQFGRHQQFPLPLGDRLDPCEQT